MVRRMARSPEDECSAGAAGALCALPQLRHDFRNASKSWDLPDAPSGRWTGRAAARAGRRKRRRRPAESGSGSKKKGESDKKWIWKRGNRIDRRFGWAGDGGPHRARALSGGWLGLGCARAALRISWDYAMA